MKRTIRTSLVAILALLFILAFPARLHAAPNSEALLREAYVTLAVADHDYKGHRVAAMKHVEAAGKVYGMNLRGEGHGRERQGESDAQLRTAANLLSQAAAGVNGKAVKQIQAALKEISVALSLK